MREGRTRSSSVREAGSMIPLTDGSWNRETRMARWQSVGDVSEIRRSSSQTSLGTNFDGYAVVEEVLHRRGVFHLR